MKIKTITEELPFSNRFDDKVNEAMDDGWHLARRDVIPAGPNQNSHRLLYAELVQLDPAPELQPADPFEALRNIQEFCKAMPVANCLTPDCPLSAWCNIYTEDGTSPGDWVIPEKGGAPA